MVTQTGLVLVVIRQDGGRIGKPKVEQQVRLSNHLHYIERDITFLVNKIIFSQMLRAMHTISAEFPDMHSNAVVYPIFGQANI